MKIELDLRYSERPQRTATAWLLAGDTPSAWLAEVARWPTSHADLRFYHIAKMGDPQSTLDVGVLAVAATNNGPQIEAIHPAGISFANLGGRLFLPVNGIFSPVLTDHEILGLLPSDDATYVWHPATGLIRYDEASAFRCDQWLHLPRRDSGTWNNAVPGSTFNTRLVSIAAAVELDADTIMQKAREDIGSRSGSLDELPAFYGEASRFWTYLPRVLFTLGLLAAILAIVFVLWLLAQRSDQGRLPTPPVGNGIGGVLPFLLLGALVVLILWALRLAGAFGGASRDGRGGSSSHNSSGGSSGSGGQGNSGTSWFQGVQKWLSERQQKFSEQLEALRHREIDRLLHMLDSQPETGLQYALPIGGDGLHRGTAEPGSRLVKRPTDFSSSLLGGGGPVDNWDLGDAYRAKLQAKYRELANREIALRRHRRAAYIFAELLGDLRAAAATLADGHLYREAAALYDQRLQDSRAAARCLEQGGLLSEAIVFYQGFGEFEKVAELYEKLQQPDFAAKAYRRAVDTKVERADYYAAAQLLENKLRVPDEAHAMLMRAWPDSSQARLCLDESFNLLARQAAHDQAATQLETLARACDGTPHSITLASSYSRVATHYPDANVRLAAADHTRVLVSHRLDLKIPADRVPLLEAIRQLAPQDRLLLRDCGRFQQRETKKPARVKIPREKIRIEREFSLPEGEWSTVVAIDRSFYAAGLHGLDIILVRGLWDGTVNQPGGNPWPAHHNSQSPILMGGGAGVGSCLFVHPEFHRSVDHVWEFPETDHFWRRTACAHAAFDARTASFYVSNSKQIDIIKIQDNIVLETYDLESNRFVGTTSASFDSVDVNYGWHPKMLRIGSARVFSNLGHLISLSLTESPCRISLPGEIYDIATANEAKFENFAAATEGGIAYWWGDPFKSHFKILSDGQYDKVCFLGRGLLIAAIQGGIEAYDITGSSPRFIGSRPGPGAPPIALLSLPDKSQAALVTAQGRVIVYAFE